MNALRIWNILRKHRNANMTRPMNTRTINLEIWYCYIVWIQSYQTEAENLCKKSWTIPDQGNDIPVTARIETVHRPFKTELVNIARIELANEEEEEDIYVDVPAPREH